MLLLFLASKRSALHLSCRHFWNRSPCSCCSFLPAGVISEEMFGGVLVSQRASSYTHITLGDEESVWVCTYRGSTPHSWHRPTRSAWLLSMTPMSAVAPEPSTHPSGKVCVRVRVHVLHVCASLPQHCAYTEPKLIFSSACVFVDRLQLQHHVTFRSSCLYAAFSPWSVLYPLQIWWMILFAQNEAYLANACYTP